MKITDYEKVQALAASNIFLLDGPNGTKTIAADALAKALIGLLSSKDFIGGVNLSELTQVNALASGNKLLVSLLKMRSLLCWTALLQWSFAGSSSEVRISEQL